MRVGIVTNFYSPDFGINTYFLCRELGKLGVDVTLFASDKYGKKKPTDRGEYEQPFKTVRVATKRILGNMPLFENLESALEIERPFHILQTEDSYQFYSHTVAKYAQKRRIPLVLRHDLFENPPFPYSIPFKFLEYFRGRFVAHNSSVAVVPNLEASLYLQKLNPALRCEIVPYGVDMHPVSVPREPHSILMVSRLIKQKGIFEMLGAFQKVLEQVPDAKLTIVGSGPYEYDLKIKIYETALFGPDLRNSVTMIPFVRHDKLGEHYSRASLFVLPSYEEAGGLSVKEALACGTPCVCTDIPDFRAVIKQGLNGYMVKPKEVDSVAEAILKAFSKELSFLPMQFSWSENAKKVKTIYEGLLAFKQDDVRVPNPRI